MAQDRGPRHSSGFEIVEQRDPLTFGQCLATSNGQNAQLFKQLASGATNHRCGCCIRRVPDTDFSVARIDLTSGKGVKTTEKRKLVATLDPEDFRIRRIGILPEKNYCCGIFRN